MRQIQIHLDLQTNTEGEPNWLLKASEEEPKTNKEETAPALRFIELVQLSLRDIVVTHRDIASDKTFELKLNEITGNAEDRKPMKLLITGSVQQMPYEVKFNGSSLAALVDGSEPWPLDFVATTVGAKLAIAGEIAEPLRGRGLALDFDFTGPMMKDLEVIFGTALPAIRSFGFRGRIEKAAGKYRIADLEGEVAKNGFIGNFEADLAGARPRLHGAIDVQSIEAGTFFAPISEEKKMQAEERRQPEQLAEQSHDEAADRPTETVEMLDLDEPILTLEPLKNFDAQFNLNIHKVINSPADLRDADYRLQGKVAVQKAADVQRANPGSGQGSVFGFQGGLASRGLNWHYHPRDYQSGSGAVQVDLHRESAAGW